MNELVPATPPPPSRRGPKKGEAGRHPKIYTTEVQTQLQSNPGQWYIVKEEASQNQYSNAVQWCKRHKGYKIKARALGTDKTKPFTIFSVYEEPENGSEDN